MTWLTALTIVKAESFGVHNCVHWPHSGSQSPLYLEWTLGVNTVWPCVVTTRVWWLTGKEQPHSPSYLWCLFGLLSCEAGWWGLTQEDDKGSFHSFAFWETYLQLKILTGLSCLHSTVIRRGHHLHVREKNNLVIFLCSSATLCYQENPWWGKQPDQPQTLFVERFPCSWIHRIWLPSKPIQVFELWHTHRYWFFSCNQCFNRIRAGAYMQKDSYSHHARWYFLNPFSGSWCCAQPHLNKSCCICLF